MTPPVSGIPPKRLLASVALLAAAMLLVELIVTRLFSVLFFYHYSFFAVSLVMSGLSLGGLLAARWDIRADSEDAYTARLARLAVVFAGALLGALAVVTAFPALDRTQTPSTASVAILALVFVPGLTAAGAFLGVAFARNGDWIHGLYAADLAGAGCACLLAIVLMRSLQGPAGLLAPAGLAVLACWFLARQGSFTRRDALLGGLLVLIAAAGHPAIRTSLSLRLTEKPLLERWNEHSRILALPISTPHFPVSFVIDRTASTELPQVAPRPQGAPVRPEAWWVQGVSNLAYRLGRPLERAAVIGVGGGRDLLAAIAGGVRHVDGYELNGILVDLLRNGSAAINPVASWPEVSLIHSEARVGIGQSRQHYDVIQASLIDTWAATAAGGFVLSENGLYTVEGWRTFFAAMPETGVLTMTRWYLPNAPAEAERLVSLAAAVLEREGIQEPSRHIILAADGTALEIHTLQALRVTILVSKTPFTPTELERVRDICRTEGFSLLAGPGMTAADPAIAALLTVGSRERTVRESPYDISAPTDDRPYFFLQLRPRDVFGRTGVTGDVGDLTFQAVRTLVLLAGLSLAFAVAVFFGSILTVPAASPSERDQSIYRWMSLYFLGIGFGYILIELGLNQRLILILGHPTLSLAVVLASMLIGTGIGSLLSGRLFPPRRFPLAWASILVIVAAVALSGSQLARLWAIPSTEGRAVAAALITGLVGFVLGFAFPLGVRLVAPTGAWAVQRMWAVNGAASIAGAACAAIVGLGFGSRAVFLAGLAFYGLAVASGHRAWRLAR